MLGTPSVAGPLRGLVQRVQDWPVASQQQARRNAMIASTACAQRRAEREEVADFLEARYNARYSAPDSAPVSTSGEPAARRSHG